MARFRDPMMRGIYDGCRSQARDNWSDFFQAKTTAGLNPMGPNAPRRGAGHRCAYWDGRMGRMSMYARAQGTLGYAAWRAGHDDRP